LANRSCTIKVPTEYPQLLQGVINQ
jgi:hypothetical protein